MRKPEACALLATLTLSISGCATRDGGGQAKAQAHAEARPRTVTIALPNETSDSAYHSHRIQAALHAFWQFYESKEHDMARQFELLSEDVEISSSLGAIRSREEYGEKLKNVAAIGLSSHRLLAFRLLGHKGGTFQAQAEVAYEVLNPQGKLSGHKLLYVIEAEDSQGILPRFKKIASSRQGVIPTEHFSDAFTENRVQATAKAWLASVEKPVGPPARFAELLARDGFALQLDASRETIRDVGSLESHIASMRRDVRDSHHRIESLEYSPLGDGEFALGMVVRRTGKETGGKELTARTRHDWLLVDRGARFMEIREIRTRSI